PHPPSLVVTARAARALLTHNWPLNIRELEMCLKSAGQLCGWDKLDVRHLPASVTAPTAGDSRRAELLALLASHAGNLAAVARALKTSRMQVHRLLKRYAIAADEFRKC